MLEEWRLFYDLPREDRIAYLNFPAHLRLPPAGWLSAGKPGDPPSASAISRPLWPAALRPHKSSPSKPGSGRRGVVNGRWSAERAHFKLPQASFLRIVECRAHKSHFFSSKRTSGEKRL